MDNCELNQEVRVGFILPTNVLVYEDQVATEAFVFTDNKLTRLKLHSFEVTDEENNVWEVTYVGCWGRS